MATLARTNIIMDRYLLQTDDVDDQKTVITHVKSGRSITVNCSVNDMNERWFRWQISGQFAQVAFNNLTADEREFIMTGITPTEWEEIFSDDNDHTEDQ